MQEVSESLIFVVDDEPNNILLLQHALRVGGFTNIIPISDPRNFLNLFDANKPDLILLDLMMPHLDGYDVLALIQTRVSKEEFLPVVFITGDITLQSKQKALMLGATDFLYKPIDIVETTLRVKNHLHTRSLYRQLHNHRAQLEQDVEIRTQALVAAHLEVMERLACAAEQHDDGTGLHTRRVGETAGNIARALGLPEQDIERIRHAAPLHDVGKIGVPDHILRKHNNLAPEELKLLQAHVEIGLRILGQSPIPIIQEAETIVRTHHEWWDGTGYPACLAGEDIPLSGRIVAVADVYDALTHERPYKPAWEKQQALDEMRRLSGTQFDPRVLAAFLQVVTQ